MTGTSDYISVAVSENKVISKYLEEVLINV